MNALNIYFFLTYKALTTAQPTYLLSLITVQPTRDTRSSSVVTLSWPPTSSLKITNRSFTLGAKLSGTVYCNLSCLCVYVFVYVWVCYHDNLKLHASIFTKLDLWVKVVTVSSWLNFGLPAPWEGGLRRGNFFSLLTTASAQCVRLFESFFHFILFYSLTHMLSFIF